MTKTFQIRDILWLATIRNDGLLNRQSSHNWAPVNPYWMQQENHQRR